MMLKKLWKVLCREGKHKVKRRIILIDSIKENYLLYACRKDKYYLYRYMYDIINKNPALGSDFLS